MADTIQLVLRNWVTVHPSHEFRCFVRGKQLIGQWIASVLASCHTTMQLCRSETTRSSSLSCSSSGLRSLRSGCTVW